MNSNTNRQSGNNYSPATVPCQWRKFFKRWWQDATFRSLSGDERLVSFYCRTGPPTNSAGVFLLSPAAAAEDLAGC
jgi:hypothetical protein